MEMDVHDLNNLIKGLKFEGIRITSARAFPISTFNDKTNEWDKWTFTYDIDVECAESKDYLYHVISIIERYTTYQFIISSINGYGD